MVKKSIVKEWFDKGQKDIEDAEFLLQNNRALENIAFHIQQGTEKFLKGFLIGHGWRLEKIHDLRKLLEEAIKIDNSFKKFIASFRIISRFYTESRYPLGYDFEYTEDELKEYLSKVKEFINLIKQKSDSIK